MLLSFTFRSKTKYIEFLKTIETLFRTFEPVLTDCYPTDTTCQLFRLELSSKLEDLSADSAVATITGG